MSLEYTRLMSMVPIRPLMMTAKNRPLMMTITKRSTHSTGMPSRGKAMMCGWKAFSAGQALHQGTATELSPDGGGHSLSSFSGPHQIKIKDIKTDDDEQLFRSTLGFQSFWGYG